MTADELAGLLRDIYRQNDERLRAEFARSLPFQDGLLDRWERAKRLGFGAGASIYNSAFVYGNVRVGSNTWIGPNVILDGSGGGLDIGAYCSIASGVHVYTHDTVRWALSGGAAEKFIAPTRIADCVYIGSQSVIGAGVNIGARVVVTANSFVHRDVPAGTVVSGSPARPIGRVEGEGQSVRVVMDGGSKASA